VAAPHRAERVPESMPVKGSYLVIAGGGAILLWSGLKGKAWSQVLRSVIAGQKPEATLTAYPISGTDVTGTTTGGGLPSVTGPSGPGETAFWTAVLAAIAAPPTKANIQSMTAWRTHECPWDSNPPDGAMYTHNPLNTTLNAPGAVSINSVGVKRYPNTAIGLAATVATLRGYSQITGALRTGRGLCGQSFSDFFRWSGGGYSSVC
jgi:hypothetical protein